MKKLVLEMMAICAGALIVSCGSGKNIVVCFFSGWGMEYYRGGWTKDIYRENAFSLVLM